jgi:hypothetical protein
MPACCCLTGCERTKNSHANAISASNFLFLFAHRFNGTTHTIEARNILFH